MNVQFSKQNIITWAKIKRQPAISDANLTLSLRAAYARADQV
jgi:hypothetical protein